jgi:hypothetical protein
LNKIYAPCDWFQASQTKISYLLMRSCGSWVVQNWSVPLVCFHQLGTVACGIFHSFIELISSSISICIRVSTFSAYSYRLILLVFSEISFLINSKCEANFWYFIKDRSINRFF